MLKVRQAVIELKNSGREAQVVGLIEAGKIYAELLAAVRSCPNTPEGHVASTVLVADNSSHAAPLIERGSTGGKRLDRLAEVIRPHGSAEKLRLTKVFTRQSLLDRIDHCIGRIAAELDRLDPDPTPPSVITKEDIKEMKVRVSAPRAHADDAQTFYKAVEALEVKRPSKSATPAAKAAATKLSKRAKALRA